MSKFINVHTYNPPTTPQPKKTRAPCEKVINILPVPIIVGKCNWQCSYVSYLHMKVGGVCPQAYHDNNR